MDFYSIISTRTECRYECRCKNIQWVNKHPVIVEHDQILFDGRSPSLCKAKHFMKHPGQFPTSAQQTI